MTSSFKRLIGNQLMGCNLKFDCSQMGADEHGRCLNQQACDDGIDTCDLYEIVLLDNLPGAIYICWHDSDINTEWTNPQWGFAHMRNCDWLLYYTAMIMNPFEDWRCAYYKTTSRNSTKYVRASVFEEFDRLRRRIDKPWRSLDSNRLVI